MENIKASLAVAVPDSVCYQEFKTFNTKDIHQHVDIWIFLGISPSSQSWIKFNTQHVYKVHKNDFVYNSFGTNTNRHHNNSKAFFACQPPWSDIHLKQNFHIVRYRLFLSRWTLYFHSFGCLVSPFPWMKWPWVANFLMRKNKDYAQNRRWCITERWYLS